MGCSVRLELTPSASTGRRSTIELRTPYVLQDVKDSNLHLRFWRPLCYRYTNVLFVSILSR